MTIRHCAVLVVPVVLAAALAGDAPALTKERIATLLQGYSEFSGDVGDPVDIDGDGYLDMVAGNPLYGAGALAYRGAIYIYFGGSTLRNSPQRVIYGSVANESLGFDLATLDYDDDGYGDIVATSYTSEQAYVYLGGPGFDATADIVLGGSGVGINNVEAAGDLDGDGDDDLIARDATSQALLVFRGGHNADGNADLTLATTASHVGARLTTGDFDGDGFRDIAASETQVYGDSFVQFFMGRPAGNFEHVLGLSTYEYGDEFGDPLYCPGDLDGDGIDDLLVGARSYDSINGALFFYRGGSIFSGAWSNPQILTEYGSFYPDYFRHAGDVNRDGSPDVCVEGGIRFGGSYLSSTSDLSPSRYDVFGVGDMNGDGFVEFVCPELPRGAIYTYYTYKIEGPRAGTHWIAGRPATVSWRGRDHADVDLSFDGGASWSRVATDVGGDLRNSLTIAVPGIPTANAQVRLTYRGYTPTPGTSVVSELFTILPEGDPPSISTRRALDLTAGVAGDRLGARLVILGDVNADGHEDVLAGAPDDATGGASAGAAHVFFGGPAMDAAPDLSIFGATGDELGFSVCAVGDVNGDGHADFAAGAPGNGEGVAYVYFGGPAVDATPDVTLMVDGSYLTRFGELVVSLGNINGDAYDDVGVTNPGAEGIYIFPGGDPMSGEPDDSGLEGSSCGGPIGDLLGIDGAGYAIGDAGRDEVSLRVIETSGYYHSSPTLRGVADSDFGTAIASVRDVNGDGLVDFAVGAPADDHAGADAGRVHVFFGGRAFDDTADLIITGAAAGDRLGSALAFVPDVNGDGFDDVAIGSPGAGAGAGLVGIYFGGPLLDARPDVLVPGDPGSAFGSSVGGLDRGADAFAAVVGGAPDAAVGLVPVIDAARYHVDPLDGQTWTVGTSAVLSWSGSEPVDVSLSVDGGSSWEPLLADAGGSPLNATEIQVPHRPTRFARLRLSPSNPDVSGEVITDGLFTVETNISLLYFRTSHEADGVHLAWETRPGPDAGIRYRLERRDSGGDAWQPITGDLRESTYLDPDGSAGAGYRLTAVNGLDEPYVLAAETPRPRVLLGASPLPLTAGTLRVRFAAFGLDAGGELVDLGLYDVRGRRLASLAHGTFGAGDHEVVWDGRDDRGRRVAAGVYVLRLTRTDGVRTLKVPIR